LLIPIKVAFENATSLERALAMFIQPKMESGEWLRYDGDDVNEPYGRYFTMFCPYQIGLDFAVMKNGTYKPFHISPF